MEKRKLTCIECPLGCDISVEMQNGEIISVEGNICPRGKIYAQNEVICPKRVITTSVRAQNGEMVSVKTDAPVPKEKTFYLMQIINKMVCKLPVKIGDVIIKDLFDGVNLVATCNLK